MVTTEYRETLVETGAAEALGAASRHYVDWAAIFAGAVIAMAVSFILLTFGGAVGLSTTSALTGRGIGITGAAIIAAVWLVVVQAASFGVGGYFAGRLRRGTGTGTERETTIRDAAHGLVAWGLAVVVAGLYWSLVAGGVAGKTAEIATTAASGVAAPSGAGAQAGGQGDSDPNGYVVDMMFRSENPPTGDTGAARAEAARILANGAVQGAIPADDRAYLARVVAARTGLGQPEAEQRVNETLTKAEAAARAVEQKAREAAETARKTGVLLGFLGAASLLIGAASASWAAQSGGRDRDSGTVHRYFMR